MKISIISSSLDKKSGSRSLAEYAMAFLKNKNVDVTFLDLSDLQLPLCCDDDAYKVQNVIGVKDILKKSDSIILSTPIYNKDVNAALKNLLDLAGKSWTGKLVGMMCSAGGQSSYMALMPFANSLMLNFRCIIIPKFVYATEDAFNEEKEEIINSEIIKRIEELCETTVSYTSKLF